MYKIRYKNKDNHSTVSTNDAEHNYRLELQFTKKHEMSTCPGCHGGKMESMNMLQDLKNSKNQNTSMDGCADYPLVA